MSLLKQLFLAICLFLVVAFSGSFVSSVENSREQLRGQLRSHAQDAATALGLSLTPHVDDPAMVQLMVSSIFDSGYFASIRVIDIKSGKPLVERVQAHAERTVPGWFERLVDLQPQGGDALIMRGWEQAARVEVVSHPQFALARLWDSALGSLYWLLACGAASLLLGGWLLRRQLRPLDQMVRQAHAISRREFLSLPRLPRTPELRRVVQAMNQMVEKLRTLFAEEAARSDKLRAQAYQDSLTGLPNRRLFDARLNEQLGAGEHEHAGQLLLLRLNDLNGLNQRLGGQRTDELIQAVARLLVDSCGQQGRADWLLARSRGGEFAVLAPGCSREQAERLAEELCEGLENLARTGASDLTPVAYLGISAFAEGDSPADLLARADQALAQAESQPAQPWASQDGTALAALNDSQDWHDWIDQALTERRLLLYFQPVVDCLDTQRVLVGDEMFEAHPECPLCYAEYRVRAAPATRLIDEGDVLDLGDRVLQVLHTPGHSPGGISLWEAATQTLFSGDIVYDGPLVEDAYHSNLDDYAASLARLRELPVRTVHGGHFASFSGERLREMIVAWFRNHDR